MVHVGLDLSRRRVDVCVISEAGELAARFRAPVDRDGLYGLVGKYVLRQAGFDGGLETRISVLERGTPLSCHDRRSIRMS